MSAALGQLPESRGGDAAVDFIHRQLAVERALTALGVRGHVGVPLHGVVKVRRD